MYAEKYGKKIGETEDSIKKMVEIISDLIVEGHQVDISGLVSMKCEVKENVVKRDVHSGKEIHFDKIAVTKAKMLSKIKDTCKDKYNIKSE